MAVSYLSKTYESNPYIAPQDLDLMSKVLGMQQAKFDAKANQIQGQINSMAALDVMKDGDRQYLNGKINGVVSQINGLGGVDLADYNIGNQIEGYASSVASDENVLNAIGSTKRARSLMASYDKMKTDPKMTKFYSAANEYVDGRKLKEWVNDGKVGSTYDGPSQGTLYTNYRENHIKMFEKLKATEYTKISGTDNPYYWSETQKKIKTSADIMEEAKGLLSPEERDQIKRDAIYHVDTQAKYTPEQLVDRRRNQEIVKATAEYQSIKSQLETNILASAADPAEKKKYMTALQNLETDNKEKMGRIKGDYFSKLYQADRDEFAYQVYSSDYFAALGNKFEVNESKTKLVFDQGKALVDKMNHDTDLFNRRLLWDRKVHGDKMDIAKQELAIAKKAAKGGAPEFNELLDVAVPDTDPDVIDKNTVTYNRASENIFAAEDAIDKEIENLIGILKDKFPDVKTKIGTGPDGSTYRSPIDLLYEAKKSGNPNKFEMNDVRTFLNDPTVKNLVKQGYFKKKDYDAFNSMWEAYVDPNKSTKLDPQFDTAIQTIALKKQQIAFNTALRDKADKTVATATGLNVDQVKEMRLSLERAGAGSNFDIIDLMESWADFKNGNSDKGIVDFMMDYGKWKKNGLDYTQIDPKILKLMEKNPKLMGRFSKAEKDFFDGQSKIAMKNAKALPGLTREDQGKMWGDDIFTWVGSLAGVSDTKIARLSTIKKNNDGVGYQITFTYTGGEDSKPKQMAVNIDGSEPGARALLQQRFGIQENPNEYVDRTVDLTKTTIATPVKTRTENLVVHTRVVATGPGENSRIAQFGFPIVPSPRMDHPEDYEWYDYPVTDGMSASVAQQKAQSYAQQWKGEYPSKSKDEFLFYLPKQNQGKFYKP